MEGLVKTVNGLLLDNSHFYAFLGGVTSTGALTMAADGQYNKAIFLGAVAVGSVYASRYVSNRTGPNVSTKTLE